MTTETYYLNLKKHYLNYMIYYQALEEYFSYYVRENSSYRSFKTIKSFNKLSFLFIETAEKNEKYSKSKLKLIADSIASIDRDYMIHEFTNDCLDANKKVIGYIA